MRPYAFAVAGLGGKIIELIVEQHARVLGDKAEAVGKIQRVGVRHGVAVAIDD